MISLEAQLKERTSLVNFDPICTVKQLWDAAIAHHKDGDFDTNAMTDIYQRVDPRLTYQDIANVISAVYADTYWSGVQMDPGVLVKHMVQALGVTRDDAQVYANKAMSQWRGMLTRKYTSDSGVIPVDNCCLGIDLLCNRDGAFDTDELIINWNSTYWNTPQKGKNYFAVRCQNLSFKGLITPKVQMFYTQAGFNTPPTEWHQVYTLKDQKTKGDILIKGKKIGQLDEGDRGASESFILDFVPTTDSNHFCAIAAVSSEFFDNNPLTKHDNWSTSTWIMYNGAAAWHNLDAQKSVESSLKFYNQDGRPEKFSFEAHCKKVPEGTVIALNFKDSKLHDANSGNVKITRGYQFVSTEATVPANHKGELKVLINTPDGELLPEGASVEVRMLWLLDHTHDRYLDAADMLCAHEDARALRTIKMPMGNFIFTGIQSDILSPSSLQKI
ncbi:MULTISPECIES: hypothetical protein [unclassified Methanosarcina]|uniref:hypothetical protein n=1 Tax=unclassified Methanosarcina TaxID=2644672 RepID=UPI000615F712|nr:MULTISPECIES: hypothetical protein [unclassified Methanosarcina]AKB17381.1 hypothetical protein MSWHS_0518 [Methanosarcina sp. WWM596]AKB20777.1 hypothetical protein MSWH1_0506 [Methanosarcina sp. WH1]